MNMYEPTCLGEYVHARTLQRGLTHEQQFQTYHSFYLKQNQSLNKSKNNIFHI